MRTASIGELTERITTWRPNREPYRPFEYIDLSAVDSSSKRITAASPTLGCEAPSRARQLVAAGDVLVSTVRPNLNAVAVVPPHLDGATASTGFAVLRPTDEVDGRFLFHWVRSSAFISEMVRRATGASYPAVSDRIVKASQIPTPSLDEQRRIAAILDHADALRAKRRHVLAHLDDLTQSIFHEMFGCTAWPQRLGDLASIQIGPFGSLLHKEDYVEGGVPVLNPMHIQGGQLIPDPTFSVAPEKAAALALYAVKQGDVLLGRRGEMGRAAFVGAAAAGALCGTGSIVLRPRSVNTEFLWAVVSSPRMKRHLERESLGTTLPNLNAKIVSAAPVPAVTPSDQERFARAYAALRSWSASSRERARLDDELFASLQARAFRGEL